VEGGGKLLGKEFHIAKRKPQQTQGEEALGNLQFQPSRGKAKGEGRGSSKFIVRRK